MILPIALTDGIPVNLKIKKSKRAKRPSIIADTQGLKAIIPSNYEINDLMKLVQEKRNWILKTSKYYERLRSRYTPEHLKANTICFLGNRYCIRIIKDRMSFAVLSENLGRITFHVANKRLFKDDIFKWYKNETTKIITTSLPLVASKLNIRFNNFSITRQKSKWGSCSRKGNLNFSALLSAAPREVIDYVIIHELAHIIEPNHSKLFWNKVGAADPLYKDHRKWLRTYGSLVSIEGIIIERKADDK
jgi:predicted metal-dependent hydrolase